MHVIIIIIIISLSVFPSRTTLKMHNIPATPMLVKKVKTNFDLSNASSSDCIPVMVLKICQSKLSHLSANSLKCACRNLVFQIVGKLASMFPVFKNVGERSATKNYHPIVFLLSLVKFLKNL